MVRWPEFKPESKSMNIVCDRIFGHVLRSSKTIVNVASGIIGMSLKHLSQHNNETDGEIHDLVGIVLIHIRFHDSNIWTTLQARNVLRNLANSAKSQGSTMTTFIYSLFKVARYYPPVVVPFIGDILYFLPKVSFLRYLNLISYRECNSVNVGSVLWIQDTLRGNCPNVYVRCR